MKKMFLGALVLCCLLPSVCQADDVVHTPEEAFAQAVEAYKKEDYKEAIRLYQVVLITGVESPATYYDLGNAYLRSHRLGKAIVNYLRAESMAPRDGDVQANLSYARAMVPNNTGRARVPFWVSPLSKFSLEEIRWLALCLFMLVATFFLVGLYTGFKRRRLLFWTVIGAFISGYLIAGFIVRSASLARKGVCITHTDVRFEPSDQATVYFKLPEGAEIKVVREKDGWAKIERADRKIGWVLMSAVEKL